MRSPVLIAEIVVAILPQADDSLIDVSRESWVNQAQQAGARVLFVQPGHEPHLEQDSLFLPAAPGARLPFELLRFANARLPFHRILVTHADCFVNVPRLSALCDIKLDALGAPRDQATVDGRGDEAIWSDDGYMLSRRAAGLVAEWPDTRKIDDFSDGAALVWRILQCAGVEPKLEAGFADRISMDSLNQIVTKEAALKQPSLKRVILRFQKSVSKQPSLKQTILRLQDSVSDSFTRRRFLEQAGPLNRLGRTEPMLSREYYDRALVRRLTEEKLDPELLHRILARNNCVRSDFNGLEQRLSDPAVLAEYVESREDEISERIQNEYQRLLGQRELGFPFSYLRAGEVPFIDSSRQNRYSGEDKLITFIFAVKNRATRARLALRTLLRPELLRFADIIVVEDASHDLLDLSDLPSADHVSHFIVQTGIPWTRSGLLNFGARQAQTPLLAACDADFLFPSGFPEHCEQALRTIDFDRYLLGLNCFETETHRHVHGIISRGSPYGHLWIYDRRQFLRVHGFEEGFVGWGHEERELESRLSFRFKLRPLRSFQFQPDLHVLHLSHTVRTGGEYKSSNRELRESLGIRWVANEGPWGTYPLLDKREYEAGGRRSNVERAQHAIEMNLRSSSDLAEDRSDLAGIRAMERIEFLVRRKLHEANFIRTRISKRPNKTRHVVHASSSHRNREPRETLEC